MKATKETLIIIIILFVCSLITNIILFDVVTGKEAIINEQCQKIKRLQDADKSNVNYNIEISYAKKIDWIMNTIIITALISYVIGIYVGKNFDRFTTE